MHDDNFPRATSAERARLHSAIAFLIRVDGRVAGVIEFFGAEVHAPDGDLLQLLDAAGAQIGHFIERREIDEVRDRLAAIVDSSDDAIVSKTLDGVITSWNRGAENIFGFTEAEAVGLHITLIIPEDLHADEDNVLARLRRGEEIDHYETVRRTKDGRLLDVSVTVSPVRNADGGIVGASKVARISAGRIGVEPEDLDFGDVIRAVVRRFGRTLAGGRLVLEVPAVRGRSDRLRLEQVVTNLVSNAIKFGADKPIEIALRADGERAYFSVTDHGIGIEPARQSELFMRFSRAAPRREYDGFGLGLWIARETVRAMGGEIWVTSTPGEGSTFSVSLPRVLAAGAGNDAVN